MLSLKPLPQPTQPIVQSTKQLTDGIPPEQTYAEYFRVLDQVVQAVLRGAPNTQTANYTLALSDLRSIVEMNVAGANTLTVPPNSAVPFAIGSIITRIVQIGAGQTTLTPGAGVTLRSRVGLKLAGQYSVALLYKRATDEWVAWGDLMP